VGLDGDCPLGEYPILEHAIAIGVVGFNVVGHHLVVDLHDDALPLDDDVHRVPLVVLGGGLVDDVGNAVETAGFLGVGVAIVDLDLVPLRGPSLPFVLGVEVETRVGLRLGHHLDLPLEVLEVPLVHLTSVEEVAAVSFDDEFPILDGEGLGILGGLPAFEVLAIEDANPAFFLFLLLFVVGRVVAGGLFFLGLLNGGFSGRGGGGVVGSPRPGSEGSGPNEGQSSNER
jgi:hypothetical protein